MHQTASFRYKKKSSEDGIEHSSVVDAFESGVSSLFDQDYSLKTKSNDTEGSVAPAEVVLPTPRLFPGDCDVKSYIQEHAKMYDGDASFLKGPTTRTKKALNKLNEYLTQEYEADGVLSVDSETPSTINSHEPGYLLSKEEDIIVGLQADEPLKRTCKPHGGLFQNS